MRMLLTNAAKDMLLGGLGGFFASICCCGIPMKPMLLISAIENPWIQFWHYGIACGGVAGLVVGTPCRRGLTGWRLTLLVFAAALPGAVAASAVDGIAFLNGSNPKMNDWSYLILPALTGTLIGIPAAIFVAYVNVTEFARGNAKLEASTSASQ